MRVGVDIVLLFGFCLLFWVVVVVVVVVVVFVLLLWGFLGVSGVFL